MLLRPPPLHAYPDSPALPVALLSSVLTRNEAVAAVNCGHASNHLGARLGRCAVGVGAHSSGFSSRVAFASLQYVAFSAFFSLLQPRLPKTQTPLASLSSHTPGSRQPIPGITLGLCFLSHPSRQGFRPGRLLRRRLPLSRRAVDGLLRSVHPFSVTLEPVLSLPKDRHCTPRPSYRVITTYPAILRGRMETFPFLGLPDSRLAGSN